MIVAMGMPMTTVIGVPMTMCTGTSTIGKHAPRRASECPGGPVFGPTVTGWSNGMTRIHIMCLGL